MEKFNAEKFVFDGMYLTYDGKFVARFKNNSRDRTQFQKFLMANFSTDEYFGLLVNRVTPLGALETKGYVSPNVKKLLKEAGYPQTQAGKQQYLADQRAKYGV